jgi:hypothetical protein
LAWQTQKERGKRQPPPRQQQDSVFDSASRTGDTGGASSSSDDAGQKKGTTLFSAGIMAELQRGLAAMKRDGFGAAAAAVMARRLGRVVASGKNWSGIGRANPQLPVSGKPLK